jgi:hypothetical protein
MPPKFPLGIIFLSSGFLLAALFFLPLNGWGAGEAPVGILDDNGGFIPKLTVTTKGPAVIFTKTNDEDGFESLKIKFKFPAAGEPGSMRGLFIQWEKEPEKWGKLWRLDLHRGFDAATGELSTRWVNSHSFLLLDRSVNRRLTNRKWDQVVELHLDGKPVIGRPTQPQPSAESRPPAATQEIRREPRQVQDSSAVADQRPAPPDPRAMDRASMKALEKKYRELADRITKLEQSVDRAAEKALEKKYVDLKERTSALEQSAAAARKWFFWGPLLALTLSIIFSSVALLFVFVRLTRGHSGGRNFL